MLPRWSAGERSWATTWVWWPMPTSPTPTGAWRCSRRTAATTRRSGRGRSTASRTDDGGARMPSAESVACVRVGLVTFELQRHVIDPEPASQHRLHLFAANLPVVDRHVPARAENDVGGQGRGIGCQAPHVEVMNAVHARLSADLALHLFRVEAARHSLQHH